MPYYSQLGQLPANVKTAGQRPHRGRADHVGANPKIGEGLEDAQVGPTTGRSAAQGQTKWEFRRL